MCDWISSWEIKINEIIDYLFLYHVYVFRASAWKRSDFISKWRLKLLVANRFALLFSSLSSICFLFFVSFSSFGHFKWVKQFWRGKNRQSPLFFHENQSIPWQSVGGISLCVFNWMRLKRILDTLWNRVDLFIFKNCEMNRFTNELASYPFKHRRKTNKCIDLFRRLVFRIGYRLTTDNSLKEL